MLFSYGRQQRTTDYQTNNWSGRLAFVKTHRYLYTETFTHLRAFTQLRVFWV